MIVARIDGGLGNQLFQAAFGMQLAQRHRTELVLDLSAYDEQPAHGYMLDRFALEARSLSKSEMRRVPKRYRPNSSKPSWSDWLAFDKFTRVREKPFGFAEKYLQAPDDCYLVGYWQSQQFFADVQAHVRRQFCPRTSMTDQSVRLYERMFATPSLALHVRRGDYVTNPKAASIYRNLSADYYRECVSARLAEAEGVEVVVFSNDISWCRVNLALPCPVHYVAHTDLSTAHEDLWLMTAAQSMVIANSTFSWWGAWLGQREDRQVFAPRTWFYPGTLEDRYLACPAWRLIDDESSACITKQAA